MTAHRDLLLGAEHGFCEFEMQILTQIRATLSSAAATASLAKHVPETEDVPENVAEILEDRRIKSHPTTSAAAQPGVPKPVIQRPLLAVGENRVRLGDLFELVFRVRIVRIAVRMIGHRKFAICALDLDICRRAGDTEHLVIIAFCICGQKFPHYGKSCSENLS